MTNSVPSWARIGAKVVCVSKDLALGRDFEVCLGVENPSFGIIYTIRELVDGDSIRLVELANHKLLYSDGYGEAAWFFKHFRPVQTTTQEQDVAIFAPLLETNELVKA